MLNFVFRKILNKKWMVISLLIGNLLLVAISAASPMYSQAVLQRTLTQKLNAYLSESSTYPGLVYVSGEYSTAMLTTIDSIDSMNRIGEMIAQISEDMDVPALVTVTRYHKNAVKAKSDSKIEGVKTDKLFKLASFTGLNEEHVRILNGKMYSGVMEDNTFEVIVNKKTFTEMDLMLDQVFTLTDILDANGKPYRIRIVGIFESASAEDPYWVSSPNLWGDTCLMDPDLFRALFAVPGKDNKPFSAEWHTVLDYTKMRSDQVDNMLRLISSYNAEFDSLDTKVSKFYFEETLQDFVPEATKLNATILVLQVPIFVLLAAFIFMVSRQMLEMEQNEISVFKSRGAAKRQIIGIYLLQSLIIALIGYFGGLPLGVLICNVLGASNAFLEFVQRAALPVEVNPTALLLAGVAAGFSICTMVLPVFKYSNVNIVDHKRKKNRKNKRPWWQLVFLDVVLLALSLYGLNQFRGQEDYLAQQVMEGASLDPTLYLCSSLFMLGAGLLVLRLLPMLIRLVFQIGKKLWSPALYASFLRIIRANNNQGFMVVFLILTVALGIFNTQTARTINANGEERIRYSVGADIVVQEEWLDNATDVVLDSSGLTTLTYTEPDFGKYLALDGIDKITKVLVDKETIVSIGNNEVKNIMLMGINTKEFGEIAWFKDKLMEEHWYTYLNSISQNANAVLVSSNFQSKYGYAIGDTITFKGSTGKASRGVIYGFIDYWPSYAPTQNVMGEDGQYTQKENYLIVSHLSQLQSDWGVTPYQIWIKAKGSTQFIYDFAAESRVRFVHFEDAPAQVIALKNDPVFQGTNGILTIGFIIVLLLCATGFLIYWVLSIQSRTLQFGIFRAMGMSMREILSMLINEQFFISGVSIGAGVVVGQLGSALYVPLIQIAYSSADRVLPLEIISETNDYVRLGIVIGLMITVCMIVLGVLISKIRISQALKLGED